MELFDLRLSLAQSRRCTRRGRLGGPGRASGNGIGQIGPSEIGRLKVGLDFVKKKQACSSQERRVLVEPAYSEISIRRQCELLGVSSA